MNNIHNSKNLKFLIIVLFAMQIIISSCSKKQKEVVFPTTMKNLSNSCSILYSNHENFLSFAKESDEEGYTKVSGLFRAIAASDAVIANNYSDFIKKFDMKPILENKVTEPKTVKVNLQTAFENTQNLINNIFPVGIETAKKENNNDAVKLITQSLTVKDSHLKLFQKAMAEIEKWNDGHIEFYVCPVCGFTSFKEGFNENKCPVCKTGKDRFVIVN